MPRTAWPADIRALSTARDDPLVLISFDDRHCSTGDRRTIGGWLTIYNTLPPDLARRLVDVAMDLMVEAAERRGERVEGVRRIGGMVERSVAV